MTKIDALRRFLLPCFSPPPTATEPAVITKKRISTSLRDDLPEPPARQEPQDHGQDKDSSSTDSTTTATASVTTTVLSAPRPSKTMVIGTIFGTRRGRVWFCVQHDRLSAKPILLLELAMPTHLLVKEMQCGLVRIALECDRPEFNSRPLRSVPIWTMSCNGKRIGLALRRKTNEKTRLMLKTMQSMTVGAGVIPAGFGSPDSEEIMYMRSNYEHVVGTADSESFHLINPDESSGQELSVFLMRSRSEFENYYECKLKAACYKEGYLQRWFSLLIKLISIGGEDEIICVPRTRSSSDGNSKPQDADYQNLTAQSVKRFRENTRRHIGELS